MTPKEKALALVQRFINEAYSEDSEGLYTNIAKKAALIAVDEILDNNLWFKDEVNNNYLKEVKQEIEKL